ncbi:hypothetical protein HXX76_004219 [Chlamydomonas incerta]|uniref:TOG domain-containing protein n=1 Tax=Chlamydomonas incerta TaxID=51695 RepID=A0A835TLV3_CHLIN|nr:hypothetical protein HXX76_004219 [Chlamydomonas incerta]|eukprot:KAG2440105.1 hypothetical protein HXX76_004219 [Chlamydomonas incerta]
MVAKCLSARTSTLTRVLEVMLLFVELEQAEKVTEALVVGLSNKNPKVVVAALEMIYNTVNLFGHRVVTPKPIIVALPALFESKDGKAREKVKEIVVELSRWMGPDAIRAVLFDKMRDAMRDDISRAMELAEPARAPPRLTRKQQAKAADVQEQAPAAAAGGDGAAGGVAPMEEDMPEAADPYDYAEPKKVAQELTSANFFAKLEEKKWTERRDAVLFLKGLADTPRIAPGDFGDVMRELKKLISKDSNVVVVAESINCVGLLAKGLRKEFASWARNLASALLEKFKEKNTNVGIAVTTALTYMHKYCWHLSEVAEDLTEAMGHANPKVKEDTYKWLTEVIKQEPKANLKGLVPALMGAAAKGAEEAAPALREAAQGFMVAFTVRFGNTAVLEKFTTKMDDARKKKLQEMVAEAMGGGGGAGGAAAPAAAAPAAATAVRSSLAPSVSLKSRLPAGGARPGTAGRPSTAASAAGGGGSGAAAAPKKAAAGGEGEDEASLSGGTLSRDQAVAALTDMFGEALVTALQDEQWKTRLDAMETVAARSADPAVAAASGSMLVQAMSHVPSTGWGEKNFQVMAKQFEVLRNITAGNPAFSKRDAFTCINGLIDKVGDLKLKQPSFETLTSLAEAVGPQFVMAQLHKKAASHKNPKVQSEAINWIARAIAEFGLAGCDVRALLDWAKEDLGSANAGVRNAAIQMLGVMYRFLGPPLGDMIRADVKPALMTAIDGEFGKVADLGKPEPTRISRAAVPARGGAAGKASGGKGGTAGAGSAAAATGGGGGGGGGGFDADDLLPRTDISGQITGELVGLLGSANWKERKAALDSIETILTQAGNRIQPQTGDLLPELKKRLADSNKNLTTQALTVLGRIARAMGRAIDRNAKPLLAPAVKNITDQKQTVRAAVTEMLDAWVGVTSAGAVMPEVVEFYSSPKITADGKAETLRWLGALVAGGKVGECAGDALKVAALGGADKAVEVRDAASKLMVALVEMVGPAELGAAAQGLDVNSRKAALEAITKITGAPVPVAVAAPVASSRPSTAAVRSSTTSLRASTTLPRGALNSTARPGTAKPAGGLLNKSIAGASMAAAAGDAAPLIMPDHKKEDRAKKGRFRPAKLQVMPDEPQTLEAEMGPLLSPALKAAAFSKDFKKHCEAADMITKSLHTNYDDVIAVVDLLFRWSTLRILESNTASLVKVLELLKLLLDMMIEQGYRMSEYESKLILPAVVEKSGHNQDKLKVEHRELLRRFALVYPPVKVLVYVKDGLESKNSKTRVVCMDEIAAIIERTGPSVYRASAAAPAAGSRPASAAAGESVMAAVAKLVAERDTAVRAACLGVIEVLYCIEGAGIWEHLGRLTDQQKSLIEERIKAAGNRMARAGQVPGYKAAEYSLAAVQDDPMMVSPGPGAATTPRRPASPMQRSSIGLGAAGAAAAGPAASPGFGRPGAGGGILESQQLRASTMAAPAPAAVFATSAAPLGPGQPGSPMQATAQPASAAVDPALAAAAGYDVRRVSSPMMMNRFNSFQLQPGQLPAVGASVGVLTMLDGGSEEETIRNWVIMLDRLQGVDWEEAIQAMKLLCFSYMEVDRQSRHVEALLMDPRNVDELVLVLAGRLDQSLWDASASTLCLPGGPQYNARACKYSINALMNMCNLHPLSARIGDAALTKMFSALLAALIDARLRQVADGDGLLKAVNMLIMKLLEQASRPGVFGALVALLRTPNPRIYEMATAAASLEAARAENLLRWNDMVVKCLIKMTKQLSTIIPTINVGEVLVHLHRYMQALGAEEVRRRSSLEDKPLRMVKTMLHELCKHRGYDIYKDMENMPGVHELPEEMVMMPYIRLNLDTLHIDKRPATAAPGGAGAAALAAAAAAPRPATAPSAEVPSTSGAAPTAAPVARSRGIPSAFSGAANTPPPAQSQVLAPLSTNAMAPPQQPGAAASPKVSAPVLAATSAAAAPPLATSSSAPLNLDPSSAEFTRPVTDEQEARNILAAIFKRIGDKSQSNQALVDLHHFMEANPNIDVLNQMMSQVSPYFKTYLSRGLNKVKLQMSHAAAAAAAAQEQQLPVATAAPVGGQQSSDNGMAPSGTLRVASSTWSTPDGDATAHPTVITIAEKLAISEARSPASPGRLRGVGNLDELRSRMNNLSTNLSDLPLRASNPAVAQSAAMSQDLLDLQERMKKIQNLGAAS